jgi:hypothetical protein
VSRTFPEPLLRTLHAEECVALHKQLSSGLRRPDQYARAAELDSRPVVLHARALRFLHDDIAAISAATNGTRPVGKPVLDLNPLETSAFLLAVLADYTEYTHWTSEPPSQVVTNFDNAFVIGGEYEEKGVRKLSIGLGIWDPVGERVVPEMSIFGINAAGHKGGPSLDPL